MKFLALNFFPRCYKSSRLLSFGLLFFTVCWIDPSAHAQIATIPIITTVAGNGTTCATTACGDNSAATSASLFFPYGMTVDSAGNLYIADLVDNRIRKVTAATGIITTLAGTGTQCSPKTDPCGDNGPAISAKFSNPAGVAIDSAGNLYIATVDGRIRKVTAATGIITTIAGNGIACSSTTATCGDGGAATSANMGTIYGLALDSAGNVYIADNSNFRIRKLTVATGIITTVAGTGNACTRTTACGDGGPATSATLGSSFDSVTVDIVGNIYIADRNNNRIRKVTAATGIISTVAGTGISGSTGDGGLATNATLFFASSVALDSAGNLYISEANNNRIRKVTAATGIITTIVGTGVQCATSTALCGDGGPAASANLYEPSGLVLDGANNLYIVDRFDHRIRKVTLLTGNSDFPTTAIGSSSVPVNVLLQLNAPQSISSLTAVASQGNKLEYAVGTASGCTVDGTTSNASGTICTVPVTFSPAYPGIRYVPMNIMTNTGSYQVGLSGLGLGPMVALTPGAIATVAGSGTQCANPTTACGDGAMATSATFKTPKGVALDSAGNFYISDSGNSRVRKISPITGFVTAVAGNGTVCSPTTASCGDGGVATSANLTSPTSTTLDSAGNIYIADSNAGRIRKVAAATGFITTIAGNGSLCSSSTSACGDGGVATSANLGLPTGVALDRVGNVYIVDSTLNRIRKVAAGTGIITTVGGTGDACSSSTAACGDGGPAANANLNHPYGVVVDSANNLYFTDSGVNRIRKIAAASSVITTVAGSGTACSSPTILCGDGGAATSAKLSSPYGLAVDSAGNLYIGDNGDNRIRKITAASGLISTVAGNGTTCASATGSCGDGGGATSANLSNPYGLAVDSAGNLFIADVDDNRIRKIDVSTSRLTFADTTVGSTSADSPQSATVSDIGNVALTVAVPNSGSNPSVASGFSLTSASTCPQLGVSSSPAVLASGADCNLAINFTPLVEGAIGGAVVLTDNALNATAATQRISLIGNGIPVGDTTATAVAVTPSSLGIGQSVTIRATMTDTQSGRTAILPTGSATFMDSVGSTVVSLNGGTAVALINGVASLSGVALNTSGTHTITAFYSGVSGSFQASSNTALATVVAVDHLAIAVPATGTAGTALSATVTAYNSDNTVATAYSGILHFTSTDSSATLPANTTLTNGVGTFSVTLKKTGSNTVTVADTITTTASVTSSIITVGAGAASTVSLVTGNAQTATIGSSFATALKVKVIDAFSNPVSGVIVTFTAPTIGASATLSPTLATTATDGTASVIATANGVSSPTAYTVTETVVGVTASVSFSLMNTMKATTLAVTPTAATIVYGQPLTVNATISPTTVASSAPTGSVTYYDGITVQTPNATVANARATYTISAASVGIHPYSAKYLGDTNFSASAQTSAPPVVVGPAVATLAGPLTQPVAVVHGSAAIIAVSITGQFSGSGVATPTGSISYSIGSGLWQVATIANGTAAISVPNTLASNAYSISVSYAGDTNYTAAAGITISLKVQQATPTVTFGPLASIVYNTALVGDLMATASYNSSPVAGTFSYTATAFEGSTVAVTGATVLKAGNYTLTATFTPTDTSTYNPATATAPLTVVPATPTITWNTPAAISYGTMLSATQLNATSTVPGTFGYTPATGTVPNVGGQILTVTFTPFDATNYKSSTSTVTLTVSPAPPNIEFTVPNHRTSDTPFMVAASSNSTGTLTYSVLSGPATISGSTVTGTGPGIVVLQASQTASGNFTAGTQNTSFTFSAGSVWLGSSNSSLSAFDLTGAALSPAAGYTGGGLGNIPKPLGMAFDHAGNVWIADSTGGISEFTSSGAPVTTVPYSVGGVKNPQSLAIDGTGQVWIANNNSSISVLSSSGEAISPTGGYTGAGLSHPGGLTIDLSGNVWITNSTDNSVTEIIGGAAPVAPLSSGLTNGTTGARP